MRARLHLTTRAAVLLFLLAGLALPLAATVHTRIAGPQLHGVVLGVAGPVIVTQEVAGRANALDGRPLDARALDTSDDPDAAATDARRLVGDGQLDAAVVIDLRETTDTLLLPAWTADDVADRLTEVAGAVSSSYGRTLHAEEVESVRASSRMAPYLLTAGLVVAGVVLAAAVSAWRGPIAATTARGIARLVGTAAAGLLLGGIAAASQSAAPLLPLILVSAATVTVAAWLVLAAEAVLGLGGLGIATGLLVGPVVPLLAGADPTYLPSPWRTLDSLAPQSAALRLARHELLGVTVADARAWLLLGAWAAIALLTLGVARGSRPVSRTR